LGRIEPLRLDAAFADLFADFFADFFFLVAMRASLTSAE
jgi:hypothetical protein